MEAFGKNCKQSLIEKVPTETIVFYETQNSKRGEPRQRSLGLAAEVLQGLTNQQRLERSRVLRMVAKTSYMCNVQTLMRLLLSQLLSLPSQANVIGSRKESYQVHQGHNACYDL